MHIEEIRPTPQGQSYGIAIGQFDMGGSVLTHEQVVQQRRRQGVCVICGKVQTHIMSKLLGAQQITKENESLFGWCIQCHTMESVLSKPGLRDKAEKRKIKWALKGTIIDNAVTLRLSTNTRNITGSSFISNMDSTEETMSSSSSENNQVRQLTSRSEGLCIHEVVEELKKVINNAPLQERGCLELAKVALARQESVTSTELNAALDAILFAMKTHPQAVEVQKSACAALRKISSMALFHSSRNVGTTFVIRGGVFALVSAMRQHLHIRSIQRDAIQVLCSTLQATSQHNKKLCIISINEFTALLDTMTFHANCKSIQIASWSLIEVAITLDPVRRMLEENDLLRTELVELASGQCPSECFSCVQSVMKLFGFV